MSVSVGDEGDSLCEINVTPMVDVLLCLLIIFMVAAPPPATTELQDALAVQFKGLHGVRKDLA